MTAATSTLNVGSGGDKILVDSLSTVDGSAAPTSAVAQQVKLALGSASAAVSADSNSGNKSDGTIRVVIATDQPSLTNAQPVSDGAGSLTVDAPVGTPVFCTPTPSTTGGWSKWSSVRNNAAPLTNTVVTVKGSAGTFGGYIITNPNTSLAYMQVFDTAAAVTLGTTTPHFSLGVPAQSTANLEITNGISMTAGMQIAATTTDSGSTALSTGLTVTIFYK